MTLTSPPLLRLCSTSSRTPPSRSSTTGDVMPAGHGHHHLFVLSLPWLLYQTPPRRAAPAGVVRRAHGCEAVVRPACGGACCVLGSVWGFASTSEDGGGVATVVGCGEDSARRPRRWGCHVFCCTGFLLEPDFCPAAIGEDCVGAATTTTPCLFCCIDFFCWKPLFSIFLKLYDFFCWNYVCFLLEPYQCVSLEKHHFCWNHIIICWNHINYLLEPCVLLFKLALLFFVATEERRRRRRAAGDLRWGASEASRSCGQGSMTFRGVFFIRACEAERQGGKRKKKRDLTVHSF
ncbi:hypothetical protein ACQJBY_049592 [Aegilops geniculata]